MSTRRIDLPPLALRVQQLLPEGCRAWLVGGAVRDLCLGRPVHDLDLAVESGALQLGQRLAARLGAAFVPLDRERGCARVVLADELLEVDLADFRAPGLRDDLLARDFTINALAVELGSDGTVIDPLGGLDDLRQRTVRLIDRASLIDDPLRGLRGVRIAAELGFTIDLASEREIRSLAPTLAEAAAERTRDELVRCLEVPELDKTLGELASLELLPLILPEVVALKRRSEDQFRHTLRVVKALEDLLAVWRDRSPLSGLTEAVERRLATRNGGGPTRRALLRLAACLHDVGKVPGPDGQREGESPVASHADRGAELTEARLRSLRMAAADARAVAGMVRHHTRARELRDDPPLGRRFVFRFLRQTDGITAEVVLLMLADLSSKKATESVEYRRLEKHALRLLSADLLDSSDEWSPRPLVTGNDLLEAGVCSAGPKMGPLLDGLLEAQVLGEVIDLESALSLARTLVD